MRWRRATLCSAGTRKSQPRLGNFGPALGTAGRPAPARRGHERRGSARPRLDPFHWRATRKLSPAGVRSREVRVMKPRTRLDKVVQIRERAEDDALDGLARARSAADRARGRLAGAVAAAQADARQA